MIFTSEIWMILVPEILKLKQSKFHLSIVVLIFLYLETAVVQGATDEVRQGVFVAVQRGSHLYSNFNIQNENFQNINCLCENDN